MCVKKSVVIILASKSPRRKQLLEMAEIPFEIITKETEEDFPSSLPIEEVPVFIARKKAKAIQADFPDRTILASDTVVVLGQEIIGKPNNPDDAFQILKKLSGKTHRVITGVVLLSEEKEIAFYDSTEVTFHPLTETQIQHYLEHYKPYDKAGAYAIQEWIGAVGIASIQGCFYNVMGLPISRVVQALQDF